ncbi:hypothetical protein [Paenibacillus aestuarii]|uniref:Uncharacterized protein n=1 Tax=Paenibacillus aestuarii TaxID=516965 RepID=A0ABW0K3I5_9BACL|nr:hypothetical protein [Paenibacillus aestuarii]
MKFDYCEQEIADGQTLLHIGLQFEDEPDSLYVAELQLDGNARVSVWKLYYNGFDCGYPFKPEEKEQLIAYAAEQGIRIQAE